MSEHLPIDAAAIYDEAAPQHRLTALPTRGSSCYPHRHIIDKELRP